MTYVKAKVYKEEQHAAANHLIDYSAINTEESILKAKLITPYYSNEPKNNNNTINAVKALKRSLQK